MELYFCIVSKLKSSRMMKILLTYFMLTYILLQGVLKVYLQRFFDETKIPN